MRTKSRQYLLAIFSKCFKLPMVAEIANAPSRNKSHARLTRILSLMASRTLLAVLIQVKATTSASPIIADILEARVT